MSKPSLGRGLGDLLGSNRGTTPAPSAPSSTVDGGLRILIDGSKTEEPTNTSTAAAPVPMEPVAPAPSVVRPKVQSDSSLAVPAAVFALFCADLALLGWVAWQVISHAHQLSLGSGLACGFTVLLAAACGCAAVQLLAAQE